MLKELTELYYLMSGKKTTISFPNNLKALCSNDHNSLSFRPILIRIEPSESSSRVLSRGCINIKTRLKVRELWSFEHGDFDFSKIRQGLFCLPLETLAPYVRVQLSVKKSLKIIIRQNIQIQIQKEHH